MDVPGRREKQKQPRPTVSRGELLFQMSQKYLIIMHGSGFTEGCKELASVLGFLVGTIK